MEMDTVPQPHQQHSQQPHKSASDSRVAELSATSTTQQHQQQQQHGRQGQENSGGRGTGRSTVGGRQQQQQHEEEYEALKYGASHVILLFVPVSICMAVVILTVASVGFFSTKDGHYLPYTPFHSDTDDAKVLFIESVGNALIMLGFVIVATVVLVVLYYYRFYKVIHGWLIVSTFMLLTMVTFSFIIQVFKNYNIPLDYLTLSIFLWNWCVVGMICIHWKGPLLLQQFYLIAISALMALLFIKFLPEWTVWTVLAILSIWDLVAVLCPKGPLRILVEMTQERNEAILPALIYSSTVLYPYVIFGPATSLISVGTTTDSGATGDDNDAPPPPPQPPRSSAGIARSRSPRHPASEHAVPMNAAAAAQGNGGGQAQQVEERGVKLGLGDFIFYSLLVGKASSYGDWNVTIACYVSILVGLAFTLMLLALFRKALPALPISIFTGIFFFFATRWLITPFLAQVSIRQIQL